MKNLHILLSALVVLLIAPVYGFYPNGIDLNLFEFSVSQVDLKNILKGNMGLYWGMGCFWLIAYKKPSFWKAATLSITFFMGGLVLGRLISWLVDGYSAFFTLALFLELGMAIWAFLVFWRLEN